MIFNICMIRFLYVRYVCNVLTTYVSNVWSGLGNDFLVADDRKQALNIFYFFANFHDKLF